MASGTGTAGFRIFREVLRALLIGLLLLGAYMYWSDLAPWRSTVIAFLRQAPLRGFLIVTGSLLLLLWVIPKWQVVGIASAPERLRLEIEARKVLVYVLGALLLLAVVSMVWTNMQTSAQRQLRDRFMQAVTQLDATHPVSKDKSLAVRLGAIYALERIARESPEDYWPIMEILAAYARMHSSVDDPAPADLQAVFAVFKRRSDTYGTEAEQPLNLRQVVFRRGRLAGIALHGADLTAADLQGTDLSGANLSQANLKGANLKETNLTGANLAGADLHGADFSQATLTATILDGTLFSEAQLNRVSLSGYNLAGLSFRGARLQYADLAGSNLSGANFVGASLLGTNLAAANLSGVNLAQSELFNANLTGASLAGANLRQANLTGADLHNANLAQSDLFAANLQEADLTGASLKETNLREVYLNSVKGLSQEQFDEACTDPRRPRWPANLTWPRSLQPSASLHETCKRWEVES